MSKTELVNYIAETAGLTKADASRAMEAMISGIEAGLKKEGTSPTSISSVPSHGYWVLQYCGCP